MTQKAGEKKEGKCFQKYYEMFWGDKIMQEDKPQINGRFASFLPNALNTIFLSSHKMS